MIRHPFFTWWAAILVVTATLAAQDRLVPLNALSLESTNELETTGKNWAIGGGVTGPMRTTTTMVLQPGRGVIANTAPAGSGANLFTQFEHGDLELELEFILPKGGNSGVYLQGRYEVQLFDSWLKAAPTFSDLGGIYQRWVPSENRGFEGVAPRVNAARAPGLWQKLQIIFQAPRFDAQGVKTTNARFVRVAVNGVAVQENVEVTGSTRAAAFTDEVAYGPVMLQGDHGPVAFRHFRYKRTEAGEVNLGGTDYAWYPGSFIDVDDLDVSTVEPLVAGQSDILDPAASGESGQGLFLATTEIKVPVAGQYGLRVSADGGPAQVRVDGEYVAHVWRGAVGLVTLTAGSHQLETRYIRRWGGGPPNFTVEIEGPELAPQRLTRGRERAESPPTIVLDAETATRVQRGFVRHAGIMQLAAVSVGTPVGVHYAYDLAGGGLLKLWRGDFLDMTKMWHHRGEDQISVPRGSAIELMAAPMLSLLPSETTPWPTQADPALRRWGYERGADGQPEFISQLGPMVIRDRLIPQATGAGFTREIRLDGQSMNHDPRVLLVAASRIEREADGLYVVGDREFYLEWLGATIAAPVPVTRPDGTLEKVEPPPRPEPVIRHESGRDELIVRFPFGLKEEKTLRYNLTW